MNLLLRVVVTVVGFYAVLYAVLEAADRRSRRNPPQDLWKEPME